MGADLPPDFDDEDEEEWKFGVDADEEDEDEDDEIAKNSPMKRYRKDSFYWYKNVIASNGSKLD